MAYNIELSLKLKQQSNITSTINNIIEDSYKFSCSNHYINYEYIYKKKIVIRNSCVISLTFDDNPRDISKFIRKIKKFNPQFLEFSRINIYNKHIFNLANFIFYIEKPASQTFCSIKFIQRGQP